MQKAPSDDIVLASARVRHKRQESYFEPNLVNPFTKYYADTLPYRTGHFVDYQPTLAAEQVRSHPADESRQRDDNGWWGTRRSADLGWQCFWLELVP